jgi:hypothetical protein
MVQSNRRKYIDVTVVWSNENKFHPSRFYVWLGCIKKQNHILMHVSFLSRTIQSCFQIRALASGYFRKFPQSQQIFICQFLLFDSLGSHRIMSRTCVKTAPYQAQREYSNQPLSQSQAAYSAKDPYSARLGKESETPGGFGNCLYKIPPPPTLSSQSLPLFSLPTPKLASGSPAIGDTKILRFFHISAGSTSTSQLHPRAGSSSHTPSWTFRGSTIAVRPTNT